MHSSEHAGGTKCMLVGGKKGRKEQARHGRAKNMTLSLEELREAIFHQVEFNVHR